MAYKLVQMTGFMWLLYEVASLNQFCSLQPVKRFSKAKQKKTPAVKW